MDRILAGIGIVITSALLIAKIINDFVIKREKKIKFKSFEELLEFLKNIVEEELTRYYDISNRSSDELKVNILQSSYEEIVKHCSLIYRITGTIYDDLNWYTNLISEDEDELKESILEECRQNIQKACEPIKEALNQVKAEEIKEHISQNELEIAQKYEEYVKDVLKRISK